MAVKSGVRLPPTQTAWNHACQRYLEGIRNGFGFALYAFSELAGTAVAAVILPKDDAEAQRSLMPLGGVKLSAATKRLPAREVAGRLTWLILSLRYRAWSRWFRVAYLTCE